MNAPTTGGFVHLHVHTEFSSLDGMVKIKDGVKLAVADGQPAFACTDHGTVGGAWQLNNACREAGIKPLVGVEVYVAVAPTWQQEPDRTQRDSMLVDRDDESSVDEDAAERGGSKKSDQKRKYYQHLTLFATTPTGWKNLATIMDISEESGYYMKPRIDYTLLKQYSEGIIALTGCLGGPVLGPVSRHVTALNKVISDPARAADWQAKADDAMAEARRGLDRVIDAVGHDNVYVEIMEHGIESESIALQAAVDLAAEYNLPVVATNDAHYTHADDHDTHGAWLAVQSGSVLSDPKRFQFHGRGYHLRSEAEMRALRPEPWWQVACDNTVKVAERFDDNVLPVPKLHLPKYPVPDGYADAHSFLKMLIREGAKKRYPDGMTAEIRERLQMETEIVHSQGFDDYFLIVWDLIKWAREDGNLPDWEPIEKGILVGPGRGSAAGAVMSYCLEIVDIDPLENNLLFERFMEPGRKDMPDIDIDFEKRYVDRVRAYLAYKWGRDKVARIGTHAVAQTKAAIKDAARVLELPDVGNRLTKVIANMTTFDELFDLTNGGTEKFRSELAELGENGQTVVDLARKINGTLKGEGIHACGIILSDEPLRGLIPLRRDRSKAASGGLTAVTAWDAPDIVDFPGVGLLKLDVLSIRNLDIVSQAIEFIEETTGEHLDARNLPHPNTKGDSRVDKAYSVLRAGQTAGVFQMESSGMKKVAQDVGPESLNDLSAILALFRPGPLSAGMVDQYSDRKAGTAQVDYSQFTDDPAEQEAIASVLGETYGVWVYQEQLMRLGSVVAGFDAVLRSKLRKAVAKKKADVMAEVTKYFLDGAVQEFRDENGNVTSIKFKRETAEKLMEAMKGSASYLFNASHSAAYAQISYITAFLKANWPAEYGAAILATTSEKERRLAAIDALQEEGVEILPPDVNRSQKVTSPEGLSVRIGLAEIDKVGQLGEDIVEIRDHAKVPFTGLGTLVTRLYNVPDKKAPSIAGLEGLIEAGAMDSFGPRLGQLMVVRALRSNSRLPIPDAEFGILEKSMRQRARLGVSLGEHPLRSLREQMMAWTLPGVELDDDWRLQKVSRSQGARAKPVNKIPDTHNADVLTAGLLSQWAESPYAKGRRANITLEAAGARIAGVMWDDALKTVRNAPEVGSIVAAFGSVQMRSRDVEDEDGNVIETVTTKEMTFRRVFPISLTDPAVGAFIQDTARSAPRELPEVPVLQLLKLVKTPVEKAKSKPPAVGPNGRAKDNSRLPAPELPAAPAVDQTPTAPTAPSVPDDLIDLPFPVDAPVDMYEFDIPADVPDDLLDLLGDELSDEEMFGVPAEPAPAQAAPAADGDDDEDAADRAALSSLFKKNGVNQPKKPEPFHMPDSKLDRRTGGILGGFIIP
ncbi:DNA polymerase III subunit alpha [Leifsonia sp. Leaf264]|uniref:DNA polymerase III subunit alpha n=1 Tax=Leifsonia sp. Leaf264 TaxID=1736314 RepID=UPI0007015967|nr:DNA polymerase III subunit alpha [Leifsonia sp. Leaf264]KQO98862.1 hypothetical protein ASF30_12430 [Leifsonia sp. Leaf264]